MNAVLLSTSETQGLLVMTLRHFQASDIFGESLLQELKSPWELCLTKRVPEVVEIRPADWPEKPFFFWPINEDV